MSNELTVIEITEVQAPDVFVQGGLDQFFKKIEEQVSAEVPDLTTKKGRDRIASLAYQVSQSKTAVEKPGRAYLKRLKEAVKPAEQEIKRFVDACDQLRDKVRQPLTEWEEEQKRIEEERAAAEEAERIRIQVEADHEIGLLMNEKFDRELEQKRIEEERIRIEREEAMKREAAERARQEEAQRQQAERDRIERERVEAIQREKAAKRQAEEAEKARLSAEEKAKQDAALAEQRRIEAEKQAKRDAELAAERAAEQERQRITEEAVQKQREEEARAADIENKRRVNNEILSDLMACTGISNDEAVEVVKALVSGKVRNIKVNY